MSHIMGRGRYARETYPVASGGASTGALRNRNVLVVPAGLTGPFTPGQPSGPSLIAAILYTPKVSGVVQVTALLNAVNGATPDVYGLAAEIATGTGLSVSGGESTSNGWVVGSNTPPVVGGAGISVAQVLGLASASTGASAQIDFAVAAAISQPLAVGVPVVIEILLEEIGGGNPIAQLVFTSLSVLELP